MSYSTARLNFRSLRSNPIRHCKAQPPAKGYALLVLMIMVAVMLISLTAALPNIYQQGQREREKEAIFRGEQYARAIYLFHRTLGRYPTSVKELLDTNGVRYLREAYRDPLSPNGKWRFIHATAAGILIDSWNQPLIVPKNPNPGMNMFGSESTSQNGLNAGVNASASAGTSQNKPKKPKHPPSSCTSSDNSSSSAQTGVLLGAFIAGVAPCSNRQSILVLDQKDHYDEWEFLGANYVTYGLPVSGKTPPGTSPLPGQPGPQGTMSQPGFSNSPSNSSAPSGFSPPGTSNSPSGP